VRHVFEGAAFGMACLIGIGAAGGADNPYAKRVWGAFNGGDMNTSLLVFRDLNRNGIFDMGDRPMPHVAVELGKPDKRTHREWTNVSGFANFRMSVIGRDREVTDPGHYSFQVLPPPGWSVTTGNARQESDYVVMPGAPGDLIALKTTHPVGLAADLTISGVAAPGSTVGASGPQGVSQSAQAGADGRFSISVTPGEWQIEMSPDKKIRKVTVAEAPVILSTIPQRSAPDDKPLPALHVVGFDDLMTTAAVFEVPSGYGGLNWYNLVAMHQRFTGGPGYINTTVSGEYIAYNSSGHPAQVFSDKPFDFVGASFGAGWDDAEGETLLVKAWRGEDLAYEDELPLSAMGPVYFAADYRRITRIEIKTLHYWQAAIDGFTYRTQK
jgi:hypothetical protein